MKNKWLYWCGLITLALLCLPVTAWAADNPVGVSYRGHIQDLGDYPADGSWVDSPEIIGTTGQSKRIEGFEIKLTGTVPAGMELRYNVHVQNKGWLYDENDSVDWPKNGAYAGTRGESLRIEAVKIVLTDRDGKAVPGYSVQYRGHVQNVGDLPKAADQWLADGAQLGTVGSSQRLEALLVQVVKTAVEPPAPVSVVYDKAGTFGPATGNETIVGDATIAADGVILQNLVITGNLTISEAVGDGNVTLNNVTVKGDTVVRGGGVNSIKINGGKYSRIVLEKTASGAVRIVAIDVKGLPFFISEAAAGETIILEGAFDSVTVNAPNMNVTTQGATTTIGKLTVGAGAAGSTVTVAAGTTVSDLLLNGKAAIKGQGTVAKAAVNADGVSFEKAPGQQTVAPTVTVPPVTPPVPPVTPPNPGGGGGGYTPPAPIAVTGVSLNKTALSLSVHTSENLIATVNPAGASNKMVSWFSSDATVATVGSDGRVTGIKEGTTEIDAFTQDGNKYDFCIVAVKDLKASIDGVTVPFAGETPVTTIAGSGQYSGMVSWQKKDGSGLTALTDGEPFDGTSTYLATITLSLIAPYTVADIDANCFKVAPATTTNDANSTVVTAVFVPVNQYRIENTGLITAYSGSDGELVIPDTVITPTNGETIVREIGYKAFYKKGLTGVTLPQKVKTIGTAAFGENDLTELVIPEGVTDISQSAFYANNNLTTVTLPGGIQVGDHAFADDLITSITIGNNATISNVADTMGVHGSAFYAYYVNAVAGKPAKIAGHYVYDSGAGAWQIDNGLSFAGATITAFDKTKGPYVFIPKTGAGTDITAIADGDKSKLTGVFSGGGLKTLTFASDSPLTTIGSLAFARNQLACISLPDTVETIGDAAFYSNQQLKNVTLSSGLKTIDDSTFQDCRLETLTLPQGLETIGAAAFAENNLAGTLTIPGLVTNIKNDAFRNNAVTRLVIEKPVGTPSTLKIQDRAFIAVDDTRNLITRITIPAGVTISDDVTTMGYYGANFKAAYTDGGAGIYNYDSGTATWIKEAIAVDQL